MASGATGPSSGLHVRLLSAQDVPVLRDLRLSALREARDLLLGDLDEEESRPVAGWVRQVREHVWMGAWLQGRSVAVARLADYPDESPRRHLEGMWVRPEARRQGLATAVVRFAEEHVLHRLGETHLGLWIVGSNEAGRRLYERLGYRPTGRRGELPDGRTEDEYARRLDAGG